MMVEDKKESSDVIMCKLCKSLFNGWSMFDRHLLAMHNKVRIFVCKLCKEKCKGVDDFDKHLTFVHGTNHWQINLAMKDTERKFQDLQD